MGAGERGMGGGVRRLDRVLGVSLVSVREAGLAPFENRSRLLTHRQPCVTRQAQRDDKQTVDGTDGITGGRCGRGIERVGCEARQDEEGATRLLAGTSRDQLTKRCPL